MSDRSAKNPIAKTVVSVLSVALVPVTTDLLARCVFSDPSPAEKSSVRRTIGQLERKRIVRTERAGRQNYVSINSSWRDHRDFDLAVEGHRYQDEPWWPAAEPVAPRRTPPRTRWYEESWSHTRALASIVAAWEAGFPTGQGRHSR